MAARSNVNRQYPAGPFRICDDTPVRARVEVLQGLAEEGKQFETVRSLAARARKLACKRMVPHFGMINDADALVIAEAALEAVQSLEYHANPVGEWFQPTDYTILHGGNCEGLSSVLVSILGLLGLTAQIVWLDQPDRPLNHVAVQVWIGGQWLWADASIFGARVGEHPYAALARLAPWMRPEDLEFRAARPFAIAA